MIACDEKVLVAMSKVWLGQIRRRQRLVSPIECESVEYDPEDILYPGESDDDTPQVRLVKKLRREDIARRYVQQEAGPNLTFRLRGPFEYGWHNPWSGVSDKMTEREARRALARKGVKSVQKHNGVRATSPIDLTSDLEEQGMKAVSPIDRSSKKPSAKRKRDDWLSSNLDNARQQPILGSSSAPIPTVSPTPARLLQKRKVVAQEADNRQPEQRVSDNRAFLETQRSHGGGEIFFAHQGTSQLGESKAYTLPLPYSSSASSSVDEEDVWQLGQVPQPKSMSPELALSTHNLVTQRGATAKITSRSVPPELWVEMRVLRDRIMEIEAQIHDEKTSAKKLSLSVEQRVIQARVVAIQEEIAIIRSESDPGPVEKEKRCRAELPRPITVAELSQKKKALSLKTGNDMKSKYVSDVVSLRRGTTQSVGAISTKLTGQHIVTTPSAASGTQKQQPPASDVSRNKDLFDLSNVSPGQGLSKRARRRRKRKEVKLLALCEDPQVPASEKRNRSTVQLQKNRRSWVRIVSRPQNESGRRACPHLWLRIESLRLDREN